jgi:hypothetical protein
MLVCNFCNSTCLTHQHGGGTFLVPYACMLFLAGLPVFLLEVQAFFKLLISSQPYILLQLVYVKLTFLLKCLIQNLVVIETFHQA